MTPVAGPENLSSRKISKHGTVSRIAFLESLDLSQLFSGMGKRNLPGTMARHRPEHLTFFRYSEDLRRLWLCVRNALLPGFSGEFRRCWKFFPDFPAARNAIPAKVWALAEKEAAGKF